MKLLKVSCECCGVFVAYGDEGTEFEDMLRRGEEVRRRGRGR